LKGRKQIAIFIVTGRTGNSLVVAKTLPFAVLNQVKLIYLFSESEGLAIPKTRYITVPVWIKRIKPALVSKFIRFIFEPLQLLYYAFKLKPDFINGVYCLPKGLNSYIVSRLTGVKCVNSIIGSILEIETELPFKRLWRRINLWHIKGCEAVTVKGERDMQYLMANKISANKMFLFNGAIDLDRFLYSHEKRGIDILYVGSFIELKGTDRIIKIIKLVLEILPETKVVMVGDGLLLGDTVRLAGELGVAKNIFFEGYQKDPIAYFQQSKILIMPSRSEGLPTSMLEAMACGCVPVISNVGNVSEAAINNFNAKVIEDFSDVDSFKTAITDLLEDEKKRLQYALNGRRTVEDNYSVESQAARAEEIINYLST
jgi:glycosyltransferase involved in cell wall biosynthesis